MRAIIPVSSMFLLTVPSAVSTPVGSAPTHRVQTTCPHSKKALPCVAGSWPLPAALGAKGRLYPASSEPSAGSLHPLNLIPREPVPASRGRLVDALPPPVARGATPTDTPPRLLEA